MSLTQLQSAVLAELRRDPYAPSRAIASAAYGVPSEAVQPGWITNVGLIRKYLHQRGLISSLPLPTPPLTRLQRAVPRRRPLTDLQRRTMEQYQRNPSARAAEITAFVYGIKREDVSEVLVSGTRRTLMKLRACGLIGPLATGPPAAEGPAEAERGEPLADAAD
jgi:hypothetical protein